MEKYYFSSFRLEDPSEIFAFPEYRVPQKVTYYNVSKFDKSKKTKVHSVNYKFDNKGCFLGTDQRRWGSTQPDYIKNCTYKDGKLTSLIYNSGNIERVEYDLASNRICDRLYSGDTLKRSVHYSWNNDTVIATITNGLSGKTYTDTIQILTNGEMDTLKIRKSFPVSFVSIAVYKKGVHQRTTTKAYGATEIGGIQGVDTAQIIDAFIFDSTGKVTKRIYTTHRGNNISESNRSSAVISHVYTNAPDGRPIEIKQYNRIEEILARIITIKYSK
jgi:YD repeat-containing protein